jgi:hypothetical protein
MEKKARAFFSTSRIARDSVEQKVEPHGPAED